jgi:rubrerythrin
MYAGFAKTAKEEGFSEIAERFEQIGAIEKQHEARYKKLLETLGKISADRDFSAWRCIVILLYNTENICYTMMYGIRYEIQKACN